MARGCVVRGRPVGRLRARPERVHGPARPGAVPARRRRRGGRGRLRGAPVPATSARGVAADRRRARVVHGRGPHLSASCRSQGTQPVPVEPGRLLPAGVPAVRGRAAGRQQGRVPGGRAGHVHRRRDHHHRRDAVRAPADHRRSTSPTRTCPWRRRSWPAPTRWPTCCCSPSPPSSCFHASSRPLALRLLTLEPRPHPRRRLRLQRAGAVHRPDGDQRLADALLLARRAHPGARRPAPVDDGADRRDQRGDRCRATACAGSSRCT